MAKERKNKGFVDDVTLVVWFALAVLVALLWSVPLDLEEKPNHLDPLVKQEIREAVKDGIQADRDEKLQQLRNLPDESVKARFVHF